MWKRLRALLRPAEGPSPAEMKRTPNRLPKLVCADVNTQVQTMAGGWNMFERNHSERHTMPANDYKPHYWDKCWCHPAIDFADDGAMLVVHNSMDRREFVTNYN